MEWIEIKHKPTEVGYYAVRLRITSMEGGKEIPPSIASFAGGKLRAAISCDVRITHYCKLPYIELNED